MKAIISNFRRAKHRVKGNQMILLVDGVTDKEKAASLIGKEFTWTSPGKLKKEIKGKVVSTHGNKGAVRCICERGMPGQSLSEVVELR